MKMIRSIIFIILLISTNAQAFDFLRGNSNAIGRTVLISDGSASDMLSVPLQTLGDRSGKVELGIERRYELKEFDRVYLASAYRLNKLTFALGFSQMGNTDLYSERIGQLSGAVHIDSLSLGLNFSFMSIGFNDHYQSVSGFSLGLGASYKYNRFAGAITIDDVNHPRIGDESKKVNPKINLFGEFGGVGTYSVLAKMTIENSETPQYGLGQKIRVSSIGSIMWGISTAPMTYGGGLELVYRKAKISYNGSYHPQLGFSQNIFVEYGI